LQLGYLYEATLSIDPPTLDRIRAALRRATDEQFDDNEVAAKRIPPILTTQFWSSALKIFFLNFLNDGIKLKSDQSDPSVDAFVTARDDFVTILFDCLEVAPSATVCVAHALC
jgi:hypothetical protein